MNQEQIAKRLADMIGDKHYQGSLTSYAAKSIESCRSNYPVSNLLTYCHDMNLNLVMEDITTEDTYYPTTLMDVHNVLNLLMDRYNIDNKLVYRKTAIHYTYPKMSGDLKYAASLSINTLLAVCEVIHCDLYFRLN